MGSRVETLIRDGVAKGIETVAAFNRSRLPRIAGLHPFLSGIHQPMTEELVLTDLTVSGTIPAGLEGRYMRIGPNPIAADPASYHWFVGDGMVHSISIANGQATGYRNRWIRSKAAAKALGELPAPGPRHGGFDTVNTNILNIAGRAFAMVEAGSYPVEVSDTLDGQSYNPFDGTLKGSFTAHPHLDPVTGEQHAICYEGKDPGVIRHVVIGADGRVVREQPIAVNHGPMIHDCAITERYVVILDLPVTFSMKTLIAGHGFPYRWNEAHPARIGLMPRGGVEGDVIWCAIDPAFAFHVANAFDLPDGRVALDVCGYDTMFAGTAIGPDASSRGLERWTVDPVARRVAIQSIDAAPQEFPRIDERRFGLAYRYAYTLALPVEAEDRFIGGTALYRHDLEIGTRQVHDFGQGRHPGEFVFVPASSESAEGKGWLIGLVIDQCRDTTDLVILDADRFEDTPTASIHIPHRVPPGFHGNWFASELGR